MNSIKYFRTTKITTKIFLHLVLIIGGLVMISPFIWMILSSFKPSIEVISVDFHFLPRTWTLRNYVKVFEDLSMTRSYINSLIAASFITFFVLLSATASGYMFSKLRFFGREALFFIVIGSIMIPPQIVLIPLYILINKFNWMDTYQGLIFPFAMSAFGTFLMRQFINGISNNLIDAARIDGASEFKIYFSIILPLVRSSMSILGILIFLWNWDQFLWPLIIINQEEMKTLPVLLGHFTMAQAQYPGECLAACTLVIGPVLVVYAFFQRQFVRSMSMTGLKG